MRIPLFLPLLPAAVSACAAAALELSPGPGVFEYADDPVHPDLTMRVYYHAPDRIRPETPVWFVIHGAGRNARGYRNSWMDPVGDSEVLLLVPEFTRAEFPGWRSFNLGNVLDGDGGFAPEENWTYSIVERLFDHTRAALGIETETYLIYGHSAGSQFVHRMLLLKTETRAEAAFLANAGWYTMPERDVAFPYGVDGAPVDNDRLAAFFKMPVVLLLGEQDTDENHHQLRTTPGAARQGPHRFARGRRFFETAGEKAAALGVPFSWSLEVVEGIAHSNRGMADAAARVMRAAGKGGE